MLPPTGFWSYTTSDDTSSRGKLSQLRALLAGELQQQIGREPRVNIFQDVAAIPPGAEWERQIRDSIEKASFIIPIVTPGFLQSEWCCREVTLFRERESRLGVRDLVFPIHYVDTEHLDGGDREVLGFLRTRQWIDFRHLRFKSLESEDVALLLETLSKGVLKALRAGWLVQQRAEAERQREAAAREAAEAKRSEEAAREARLTEGARQREAVARQAEEARRREEAAAEARRKQESEGETQARQAAEQETDHSSGRGHRGTEPAEESNRQEPTKPIVTPHDAAVAEHQRASAGTKPGRSSSSGFAVIAIGALILVSILAIAGLFSGAFTDHTSRSDAGDQHASDEPKSADVNAPTGSSQDGASGNIAKIIAGADANKGKSYARICAACHNLAKDGGVLVGPPLWGVVDREKGSVHGFDYSEGMKSKGGKWTYADLDQFLTKPQAYVHGTKMGYVGEPSETKRAELIAYLRTLADNPVPLP